MGILDSFSLKGKVVLVTGGPGLYGRQEVEAVAEAGATTYTADLHLEAARKQAEALRDRGYDVTALAYDQGDECSILPLCEAILERSGKIDVLVNNAVGLPGTGDLKDEGRIFAESVRINATGLFVITRAFGDAMKKQGSGSIINIGSIHGLIGPDLNIYRGTTMTAWYPEYFFNKGGMINFTRFMGSYYGQHGIRCNCVCPGGYRTDDHPDAFVRQYSERTFLGRLAGDMDLRGIIVFLSSDASAYISGAIIPVDGGYVAR